MSQYKGIQTLKHYVYFAYKQYKQICNELGIKKVEGININPYLQHNPNTSKHSVRPSSLFQKEKKISSFYLQYLGCFIDFK